MSNSLVSDNTIASSDIRVIVGIDFGTTYSGFAFAHTADNKVETNVNWPGNIGSLKTNTALLYKTDLQVSEWGYSAMAEKPQKKRKQLSSVHLKPVELFKLHLAHEINEKPPLLQGLDYEKAITDYLREMGNLIKETISKRWPNINFFQHVRIVASVPAEYDESKRAIIRRCIYGASLTEFLNSGNLEFTTEPEAAAIYCMRTLPQYSLSAGSSFLTVDGGGGTVDLTIREFLPGNRLSEVTERSGDYCGSAFVDKEFLKYLSAKVGTSAMKLLESQHYGQMQYMVQEFCKDVKFQFDGNRETFKTIELDLEQICPILMQLVTDDKKDELEEAEWLVELDFNTVLSFFDHVVHQIISLVRNQLSSSSNKCSALFMVGGFSESPYLLQRIREEFQNEVDIIAVPPEPIASVIRGAVYYGLEMKTIQSRVLKRTFGVEISPPDQSSLNTVKVFHRLAERGTLVPVDTKFGYIASPVVHDQTKMNFAIYTTPEQDGAYCNDEGMSLFGELSIDLPDVHLGLNRRVQFTLTFGEMETRAIAKNLQTDEVYQTSFKLEF